MYTINELVESRQQALTQMEQLEASVKVINEELLTILREANLKGQVVDNYQVTRSKRVNVTTPLEEAVKWGAVMTKTVVDTTKVKDLYKKGIEVPGVNETEYITVREIERSETREN